MTTDIEESFEEYQTRLRKLRNMEKYHRDGFFKVPKSKNREAGPLY